VSRCKTEGVTSGAALRQASVLFVDVVGSTAIGSVLDPEAIQDVIDPMLVEFTAIVTARRGRVLKYTGDGLLAAFGAAESQEDTAEQAVRSGIEMIEAMRRSDADERLLRVRVGIDSGEVLVGGGVEGDQSIRGSTVNMAARMEQHAPIDGLRISAATYRLVRGLFDVIEQPPIEVKGAAEPLLTYVVERARPRTFRVPTRGIAGVETPMVGRSEQLATVCDAYTTQLSDPTYRSIVVVGDAGVGKSRLLYEFEHWLAVQRTAPIVLRARAQPRTGIQPFGLLRDLLTERLAIADNDTADVARQRLVEFVVPLLVANGVSAEDAVADAHLLGHLIGFDWSSSPHVQGILGDARQIRFRAFAAISRLLRSSAVDAPVVLLMEDLHWADDGSLDLLETLGAELAGAAVLVVSTTRPELFERRPRHAPASGPDVRLELRALGDADTAALADALLGRLEVVPAELRELLVGRGDGNPYFMEELIRMLLDDGAIAVGADGRWHAVAERLRDARVPPTLAGVLQSRFDALAPVERAALQAASVIGAVSWDTAVEALVAGGTESLPGLVSRGFLVRRQVSSVASATEVEFRHHLMHRFVYDTLLKRERRELHTRAAAWYAPMGAERGPEHLALTGEHYERAGESAAAVDCYSRAAEEAADRGAHDSAVDFVGRALEMLDVSEHAARWRLLLVRERLLALGDDRPRHQLDLDALEVEAEALDDDAHRAMAAWRRSVALYEAGEHSVAEEVVQRALTLAGCSGDRRVEALALATLASTLRRLDRRDEAKSCVERGLEAARGLGDRKAELVLLQSMSAIMGEESRVVESERLARQGLELARDLGDRMGEASALNRIGGSRNWWADHHESRRLFAESIDVARRIGHVYGECIATLNLSGAQLLCGEAGQSLRTARASVDLAILAGTRDLEAAAYVQMGLSLAAVGRFEEAIEAHVRSCDLFVLNECPQYTLDPLSGIAAAYLSLGDLAAATTHVDEILRYLDEVGNLHGVDDPAAVLLRCYRVLDRGNDPRARDVLKMAHDWVIESAAELDDSAERERYFTAGPSQREILAAWTASRVP
jgi:class 3 adenylate cyclase/tetratricopeptide (TPR) repeat protein